MSNNELQGWPRDELVDRINSERKSSPKSREILKRTMASILIAATGVGISLGIMKDKNDREDVFEKVKAEKTEQMANSSDVNRALEEHNIEIGTAKSIDAYDNATNPDETNVVRKGGGAPDSNGEDVDHIFGVPRKGGGETPQDSR